VNRLLVVILALLLLVSLPLSACGGIIKGSGELKTEDYTYDDFSGIDIKGAFEVDITHDSEYYIGITADDNIFEKMEISQENDTLFIELKNAQYVDTTARVVITLPHIRSLGLDDAATGTLSGFDYRASIEFDVSGARSSFKLFSLPFINT